MRTAVLVGVLAMLLGCGDEDSDPLAKIPCSASGTQRQFVDACMRGNTMTFCECEWSRLSATHDCYFMASPSSSELCRACLACVQPGYHCTCEE